MIYKSDDQQNLSIAMRQVQKPMTNDIILVHLQAKNLYMGATLKCFN